MASAVQLEDSTVKSDSETGHVVQQIINLIYPNSYVRKNGLRKQISTYKVLASNVKPPI